MARTHWPVPWFFFFCHHRICETDNVWTYFNSLLRKSLSTASDRSLMLPWVMWKGKRASRLRREDKQRQITFIQRHGQVITVLGWRTHCHDLTLGLYSMTPTLVTRSHWPTTVTLCNQASTRLLMEAKDSRHSIHFKNSLQSDEGGVYSWLRKDPRMWGSVVQHLLTLFTCKVWILSPTLL